MIFHFSNLWVWPSEVDFHLIKSPIMILDPPYQNTQSCHHQNYLTLVAKYYFIMVFLLCYPQQFAVIIHLKDPLENKYAYFGFFPWLRFSFESYLVWLILQGSSPQYCQLDYLPYISKVTSMVCFVLVLDYCVETCLTNRTPIQLKICSYFDREYAMDE